MSTLPAPHVVHDTSASTKACTNCGHPVVEVYCAKCGEKQPDHHDLTFGHFAHEAAHELLHVDSKVLRTMRDLVTRPGSLTAEYFAGRKKRYIPPLRLFLTLFAVVFLIYTAVKPVAIYSMDGLMSADPRGQLKSMLRISAAKHHIPYEEVKENIEHRWQKNMSTASLLGILPLALILKLLYRRRYFAEALVFSTHYICFSFTMSLALLPVYFVIGIRQSRGNVTLMVITSAISLTYMYLALHRVYGQRGGVAFVKAVVAWATSFGTSMVLMAGSLLVAIFTVLGV
ncbi:MAG TPA: DUF3667 domain-containing protein [Thermoanaerobaculia bacterium]|nr:DUF3667 domain-containing protein [Thermoanaerobaculia bacterium]